MDDLRRKRPPRRAGTTILTLTPLSILAAGLLALSMSLSGCKVKDPPPITAAWTDDFERTTIGSNYYKTGGGYQIENGALGARGSYNYPLWLRKKLPRDVLIELDTWSNTPDGDIKVELFGDGVSHAHDKGQYTSSGYVLIMGGWGNSKSMIARGNEHGKDLVERTQPKVQPGKRYHWKIQRKEGRIDWWVDGELFLSYEDEDPLRGNGNDYFGFNNWESDAWFDNLAITPL